MASPAAALVVAVPLARRSDAVQDGRNQSSRRVNCRTAALSSRQRSRRCKTPAIFVGALAALPAHPARDALPSHTAAARITSMQAPRCGCIRKAPTPCAAPRVPPAPRRRRPAPPRPGRRRGAPAAHARRSTGARRRRCPSRNYSDNYLSGMDPDPKRNVAVEVQIDTTVRHVHVLILIVYGAIHGSAHVRAVPVGHERPTRS